MAGIGCDRGASRATLEQAIDLALAQVGIDRSAIQGLATIDKKADELALLSLAQAQRWPIHLFRAAELATVAVPNPSELVRRHMGTPAVAEAAALLAARAPVTALLVEKFKYRGADGKHATVSLARIAQEDP